MKVKPHILKTSETLSQTHKNPDENEDNTQELLISYKAYNSGAPCTDFIITPTFVWPGGTSKGPSSDSLNNIA